MSKILCATDYSKSSVSALQYAYSLSKKTNSELVILNIIEYPTIWNSDVPKPSFTDFEKGAPQAYRKLLKEFCTRHLGTDFESGNVTLTLKNGNNAEDGILEYCAELQPSILIVGVKGMSPLKEIFMGSTTKSLITNATSPVMIVPHEAKVEKFQKIVYATTLMDNDLKAVQKLVELFSPVLKQLEVIHIKEKQQSSEAEDFKNKLRAQVSSPLVEFKTIEGKDIFETLKQYLKEHQTDVVGMFERQTGSSMKNLFHKDLVKRVESSTQIPLISFSKKSV